VWHGFTAASIVFYFRLQDRLTGAWRPAA
jgi:hypothetical protein